MLARTGQLKTAADAISLKINDGLKVNGTNALVKTLLFLMAKNFNWRPGMNGYLKSDQGWINFTAGICTENKSVDTAIQFKDGKATVLNKMPADCDTALMFKSDKAVTKLLGATPTEQIFMIMKSELKTQGNINYLHLFFFFMSLLLINKQKKMMAKEKLDAKGVAEKIAEGGKGKVSDEVVAKMAERLKGEQIDLGVKHLTDPYLSDYSLNDFPRVQAFLDIHFEVKPEICPERPKLVTDWCKKNGFETDTEGHKWIPELRQGHIFKYLLQNKKPIIRKNDLIAGTTTTK
ncbi:hypothetical protein [Alkalimarinus alittae]|uniref:PFL domain-containing protein n=1 Tax=Alkalimarinus alittae TaxID=2961619 RepID=A0ABY6N113_9ALTE|nr:hypothetical protein [Alkalimarinus alittae]UZE95801.1 hypothetical protein NKI27_17355 [Alkalimarinus alittae]